MKFSRPHFKSRPASAAGFTMIEIAICLAIIGFALVAIIGVLPYGMNTQRDNREETVINQDATVLLEAIRSGARGMDSLTNYVYQIVITRTKYPQLTDASLPGPGYSNFVSGAQIIGLLSTPQLVDYSYRATNNLFSGGYSNHVIAYVRSISGLASEKPPQNNSIMVDDSFTYRIYLVNAAPAYDTNNPAAAGSFGQQLAQNFHELRMTFLWPQLPNGNLGSGRQTFRASIAGQLNHQYVNYVDYYFYQSQYFTNAP